MSEGWNTFQTYAEVIELKKTTSEQEVQIQELNSQVSSFLSPIGAITLFAGQTPPAGWLLCNGIKLLPSAYPELFAVIGYTYGQIDDFFNLPSLVNRFPIGASETYPLTTVGGSATITVTTDNLPSHSHKLTNGTAIVDSIDGGHTHTTTAVPGRMYSALNGGTQWTASQEGAITSSGPSSNNYMTSTISGNTDASTAPSTPNIASLPPYLALNYIICYTATP
jgi:microcystin-dependent protein